MPAEPRDELGDNQPATWSGHDGLMPPNEAAPSAPTSDVSALPSVAMETAPPPTLCTSCRAIIGKTARFCAACGTDQNPALARLEHRQQIVRHEQDWRTVRGVVWFYLIYLATVLPLVWIPDHVAGTAMLAVGGIDAFLILGYWWHTRTPLGPDLRPRADLMRPTLIGCGLLLVLLPLNVGYHDLLHWMFTIDPTKLPSITKPFEIEGYGLAVQLFAIALMPAIWEEIAFRGLIQDRLRGVVGTTEAIGLTAILFAIIHVQWLSLPYLFLLGVILGILRHCSRSLLPGMVLHGLHNAAIVVFLD